MNSELLTAGLAGLVPELLKATESSKYKSVFGPTMEDYIGTLIKNNGFQITKESEIKKIYQDNNVKGKVVDFLIKEDGATIFIDSKAIEPGPVVKTSADPATLKNRLEGSFIKGIIQTQVCAHKLDICGEYKKRDNDVALIVTHNDHFISTGRAVENLFDTELSKTLESEVDISRISLDRTYYITIDNFEMLLALCKANN